jgi:hypothetical protein
MGIPSFFRSLLNVYLFLPHMKRLITNIDSFLDTFSLFQRGRIQGYFIAATMISLALVGRLAIAPVEAGLPFLTFFPAVTLAAVLGGTGPGLFAMLISVVLVSYMFIPPFNAFPLTFNLNVIWSNIVFCVEEIVVILVVEAMYRQHSKLITTADLLEKVRQADAEVRRLELEFRSLAENLPDIVSRFDRNLRRIYVNPEFEKATGISREFALGKTHMELGVSDELSRVWTDRLNKVFATGTMYEFEFINMNGTVRRQYQARSVPEFDSSGKVQTVLTIARDITALKESERTLRESEARFQVMTANVPGMVFQCIRQAEQFHFSYISNGAESLLGVSAQSIEQNKDELISRISAECRQAFHDTLERSQQDMALWNWEGHVTAADGSIKWINLRATPRSTDEGHCIWDGVAFNVTESKHNEEKLLESQLMLRELSAHLESVREEERKHIAREIHDELGQALTALRMDVSLARLGFGESNPELMIRLKSMSKLVHRTVEIARHITTSLRPGALDMGITAALEWLVEEFTGYTKIPCELAISDGNISLDEFSATAVFRIVQESLTNIARHSSATQAEVIVTRSNDELCFEICDNGIGFDPASTANRKSFGLIGIKERVAMLNGSFEINSRHGVGTRLRVRIPVA